MGVSDRDYMRRGGPSFGLPANWTLRLIVVLVVAWLIQNLLGGPARMDVLHWFGLSGEGLLRGRVWTLLTYALLHLNSSHLFWNCLGLWFFGDLVERSTDPRDIPRFGIMAAVAGGVGYLIGGIFGGSGAPVIGSSAILSAVLAFGALRFPHTTIRLFFLIPVPLWLLAILIFAGDVAGAMGESGGGIAYLAHIGGALYGLLVHRVGIVPRFRLPALRWRGTGKPGGLRSTPRPPDRLTRSADDQRRVDELLDKIHREGIGALSDQERAFLADASKRYR